MTHDLGSDATAYDGQRVVFTCIVDIVVGRDIVITWSSDDYIGTGGDVLQVASNALVGFTVRKSTTVVTLTRRVRNNRVITIETQMQITASEVYPTSSVSCRPNGVPPRTVIFFTLPWPAAGNAHWSFSVLLCLDDYGTNNH